MFPVRGLCCDTCSNTIDSDCDSKIYFVYIYIYIIFYISINSEDKKRAKKVSTCKTFTFTLVCSSTCAAWCDCSGFRGSKGCCYGIFRARPWLAGTAGALQALSCLQYRQLYDLYGRGCRRRRGRVSRRPLRHAYTQVTKPHQSSRACT